MYGEGYCLLLSIRSEKTLGSINDYRFMNIKQFKNVLAVYNGLNKKVFLGGVFYIRDTILKVKFKSNLLVFFL